jgi:23S rRNA (adenine2030-N6)-methyltransferase
MLSYRHGFHAGNHADVLKHCVLVHLLQYMVQKEVPITYADTHAGAGWYPLDSGYAQQSGEFTSGIQRIWDKVYAPPLVHAYLECVKRVNPDGRLHSYPGSPVIASHCLRAQDRLRLFERHPSEIPHLEKNLQLAECFAPDVGTTTRERGKRIIVMAGDGFEGLKSILPPPSRRGLILIDPSYELKEDYRHVSSTIRAAAGKFSTGTYAVWYPILSRPESRQLAERLKRDPVKKWLNVSLTVKRPAGDGLGLLGSGMFVVNPPWTLRQSLEEAMPFLLDVLREDSAAQFRIESAEA